MAAIWTRARAELRARARATIALAMLVGLGGAAVLAAAAGARRTDTAYPRFLRAHGASDLASGAMVGGEENGRELSVEEVARFPAVRSAQKIRFYLLRNPAFEPDEDAGYLTAEARSKDRAGPPIDTGKVLEGRLPNPAAPDEAAVTILGARNSGLRVGDTLALEGVPDAFPDFARAAEQRPLTLRVVGRVAYPGDFPPQTGDETVALRLTPAFYERYPETAFGFPGGFLLRLQDVPGAADRYRESFAAIGGNAYFTIERTRQHDNVQRSFHLQALALWVLAGLGGVAVVLIMGQTIARQVTLEADDNAALRALGMSRGQLFGAAMARVLAVAVAGAAAAVLLATAASQVAPAGLARAAEPSPGVSFDAATLGIGAAALVVAVMLLAAWPAWRASRAVVDDARVQRPSAVAGFVARLGRLPATVAGTRLALERGRGRTSMPVRSTIAGLVLGLAGLAAGATFASSLDHLLDHPRLYGATWDARVGIENGAGARALATSLVGSTDAKGETVRGVSIGRVSIDGGIGEDLFEILAIEPVAGAAPLPPLLQGRHPRTRDAGATQEIMLGKPLADAVGARVGDTVGVAFLQAGVDEHELSVVGIGVVPLHNDTSRLGFSATMTPDAVARAVDLPPDFEGLRPNNLFVDGPADLAHIASLMPGDVRVGDDVHVWPQNPPTDIVNFGSVQKMPLLAGLLLGAFALATLVHTLVTAIRRRARDLAILTTLGFVTRQVKRAVHVQATVLAAAALLAGVPLGVAAGRWLWTLFAREQGLIARPLIHAVTLLAGVPVALILANAIAALPARAASRTEPALVLRSE